MKSNKEFISHREAAYFRLMDGARDIVLLLGIDGQILYANRAAVEAYGYSRDELLGLNIKRLRALATLPDLQRQLKSLDEAGALFETQHTRRNGTAFSVEVSSRRTLIAGQEILISVIRDISDRKRAENELLLAQFSVENAAEATFWIEEDGRIAYANKKACELLGYPKADLSGMSILDIDMTLSPDDWAQRWQEVKQVGAIAFEGSHRTRDGHVLPVEGTSNHVEVEGRELHCTFFRTTRDRKILEAQLRQAQKMEAIGRLAGGVAHDFNNILTIISGYAELLESEVEPSPSAQKKIKAILTAANRGAALTGQLLAFSRKQVLQTAVLNLNSTVQQVADMVGRVVGEDVEVKVITHPKLGTTKADGGQMAQVILNLVVNARDAMPNGGRLTIETANVELGEDYAKSHLEVHPGEYVMLSVSDSGCGMDAETCSHIFEPFFTTKPRDKGTGLGLSTVYGIVKQSGGNITVYSEVGRGTTFKIYFPVVRAAGEVIPSPTIPSSANIRGRGEQILVIEDDKILRSVITEYLSESGYRVLSASNHDEALRLAQSNRDDLVFVLTDMILFGKSGHHIAEAIKKEVRNVEVVYMSGYPSDAIVEDGVLARESHFLLKPFTRMALLQLIHKLLQSNGTSIPPKSTPQWSQMAGDYGPPGK